MTWFSVRHDPEQDIIRVEIQGEYDARILSASSTELAEEIERSSCQRVLMDHRKAIPRLTVLEQFDRPRIAEEIGVPKTARIAIVYQAAPSIYSFIETVAVNRGLIVKVFTNEEQALEWLHQRDPSR